MTLRDQHPDIARAIDGLREIGMTPCRIDLFSLGGEKIVAWGKPLPDLSGCVEVSGESYVRMREYAVAPPAQLPRMEKKK